MYYGTAQVNDSGWVRKSMQNNTRDEEGVGGGGDGAGM